MKRRMTALAVLMICLLPITASANSSWRWLSETRPYDVLPFVAVITIAIETAAMWYVLGKQHLVRIAVAVVIANLLSFAAPYLWMNFEMHVEALKSFSWLMENGHYYTVGCVYLCMTLMIEVPVVFLTLRKHTGNKWRFLLTVVGSNALTTLITAAAERIFCYGHG
ncbi:MAG: hypothetical protein E7318_01145 [Clostridiales bacterium]|nr:hypothetical protein [Clostridiales bacterium]